MLLLVLNIEFQLNYSLMLFSLTCFDINIKYMHAGTNHCLAAAAVSRRQKSASREDVGLRLKVEITLIVRN